MTSDPSSLPAGHDPGPRFLDIGESDFPMDAALSSDPVALAVITDVDGPSYRPVGATMVVNGAGRSWGHLSSGCVDKDVILHAQASLATGRGRTLRYGRGSAFIDMQLPCGGGLDIMLFPHPDRRLLAAAQRQLLSRMPATLGLSADGQILPASDAGTWILRIVPKLRFIVFGNGLEARCFADLALSIGCPVELFSSDSETLAGLSCGRMLAGSAWPKGVEADAHSAILLFFHDHDREPALLESALASKAFYIGAQGSRRAHQARCAALLSRGVAPDSIARLASPFGLIPSARDPRTLAISVMAHVLDRAGHEPKPRLEE